MMATEYEPQDTTWDEVLAQTALVIIWARQVECGLTTHRYGDCTWCGAAL